MAVDFYQEGGGASTDPRHKPWRPSAERDSKDPELAAFLRKVTVSATALICDNTGLLPSLTFSF